jgi:hypothetical protein
MLFTFDARFSVQRLMGTLIGMSALVLFGAGCGDDETAPSGDEHTPVSYTLLMDDVVVSLPYTFPSGQTVRVRLIFLNANSENLDEVEATHFAGLIFDPGSLAAVERVSDHHYQFDVTGGSAGSGTVTVSFGHDELADETTFPEAAATVAP